MKNSVKYFALFRDQTGCESELVDWGGGTTAELFDMLSARHTALRTDGVALVAINDEMSNWETAVADGDEVLFFPPVSGG